MPDDKPTETHDEPSVTRRQALLAIGSAGTAFVAGGAFFKTTAAKKTTKKRATTATTAAGKSGAACVLTNEATEGPYYIDLKRVRSDIREGHPGTALTLKLLVVDATTCQPIANAAVDIWHCDATGSYSGFTAQSAAGNGGGGGLGGPPPSGAGGLGGQGGQPGGPPPGGAAGAGGGPGGGQGPTDNQTFLRGTQITDATGLATFQTVYPGWYQGRTVHIHVKAHVGGNTVHTGQLFFDDALTDKVFAAAPYKAKGARSLRNSDDGIYQQAGGKAAILAITPSGSGYTGALTMGVKRA